MKLKLTRLLLGALLPLLFPLALSAQNFAYFTNPYTNSVLVIYTTDNMMIGTGIRVGTQPQGVAITPDGTRAYVTDFVSNSVSVIDTNLSDRSSFNTVLKTIPAGITPFAVAITPDGTRAYVTSHYGNYVSVIDTSSNTVISTAIQVGIYPDGVAITPDGTRAYVTNYSSNSVSVIDTNPSDGSSYNTVLKTIPVGTSPFGVAITPDGTRAYVTNYSSNSVSVIDTSTNSVIGTPIPVEIQPHGVAITPDGTRAYIASLGSTRVSMIDTNPSDGSSYNTVSARVEGLSPHYSVAITPAVPFSAFSAKLDILAATLTTPAGFDLKGAFTLGYGTATIDPVTQPLTLRVGSYRVTLPAGSFQENQKKGTFTYEGTVSGVSLQVRIAPTGADAYTIQVDASGIDLSGLTNPVTVTISIGGNAGTTSVTADFQ